jgi:hypothetical protein
MAKWQDGKMASTRGRKFLTPLQTWAVLYSEFSTVKVCNGVIS